MADTLSKPFDYRQRTLALDDLAGMTDALHDDGFALVPGVLSPDEVQAMRDAIDRSASRSGSTRWG